MEITVAGVGRTTTQPEQAVVPLTATHEGHDLAECVQVTQHAAASLAAGLEELRERGVVTTLVVPPLSTWSWQEPEGRTRYGAKVVIEATFGGLTELAGFVGERVSDSAVRLGGIRWELSAPTRDRLEHEVLAEAMQAARRRAETIAGGEVELVEAADPGLLRGADGSGSGGGGGTYRAFSMGSGGSHEDGYDLRPEDIEVATTVHARFTTR